METIGIQEVLSQIRSATDQTAPFLIEFVKSTGRSRGVIRTLPRCLKGFPNSEKKIIKAGTGQGQYSYKEHDVIPLIDLDTEGGKLRTIPISHIIGYNQYKVIH